MKLIALDIETTGLNPRKDHIHGIGFATNLGTKKDPKICSDYLGIDDPAIKTYLTNPENHVVGHNLRFDLKFLIAQGFEIKAQIWDTKLMAQLVDENRRLGLKDLTNSENLAAKREIDHAVGLIGGRSVADLCKADLKDPSRPYRDLIASYCKEDCINTLNLFYSMADKMTDIDNKMYGKGFVNTPLTYLMKETLPVERVLLHMELRGIKTDEAKLRAYREELLVQNRGLMEQLYTLCGTQITNIEEDLYEEEIAKRKTIKGMASVKRSSENHGTKFNWQSSDHISLLIFDQYGISKKAVEKTKTGKPSTSESSLEDLRQNLKEGDDVFKMLTLFKILKKNQKLISTYTGEDKGLVAQLEDGRIFAEYLQAGRGRDGSSGGTVTGRLSSRNPSMQNLPRESAVRSFFIPDTDNDIFVYFDYSQLELRLAAHLSQDPLLMQAYHDNVDLHELTAQAIGADRQVGKKTNFAMIYDASAYRLSSELHKSVDECQHIINGFYNLYGGYKKYLQKQLRFMVTNGLVVAETGRIRRLPDVKNLPANTKEWRHAVKQGYNFPIQSLGASITKRAMIELHRRGFTVVTQVHDSVVIQLPKGEAEKLQEIKHIAETIYPLTVPLKVDIKLLTSLLESDKLQIEGVENEQCSNDKQNQRGV